MNARRKAAFEHVGRLIEERLRKREMGHDPSDVLVIPSMPRYGDHPAGVRAVTVPMFVPEDERHMSPFLAEVRAGRTSVN